MHESRITCNAHWKLIYEAILFFVIIKNVYEKIKSNLTTQILINRQYTDDLAGFFDLLCLTDLKFNSKPIKVYSKYDIFIHKDVPNWIIVYLISYF